MLLLFLKNVIFFFDFEVIRFDIRHRYRSDFRCFRRLSLLKFQLFRILMKR